MKYTTTALLFILCTLLLPFTTHTTARASSVDDAVVFATIQAIGENKSDDAITVQNVSAQAVDVSNWRIRYTSASGKTVRHFSFAIPNTDRERVMLPAGAADTFTAPSYLIDGATHLPTGFALNHQGGSLSLVDAEGVAVHSVAWGTAERAYPVRPAMTVKEGIVYNTDTKQYERMALRSLVFTTGGLVDVVDVCGNIPGLQEAVPDGYTVVERECNEIIVDVCSAVDGVQATMPVGYRSDGAGDCEPIDVCPQIDGVQPTVPVGYELQAGACVPIVQDLCSNIEGIQQTIPDGMVADDAGVCSTEIIDVCPHLAGVQQTVPAEYWLNEGVCTKKVAPSITITEVLPNPAGVDAGTEYIELHNAHAQEVDARDVYIMRQDKQYQLSSTTVLQPHEYRAIPAKQFGISLANSGGAEMMLYTAYGAQMQSVPAYQEAKDDESWSLGAKGTWQYMEKTPNAPNTQQQTIKKGADDGKGVETVKKEAASVSANTVGADLSDTDKATKTAAESVAAKTCRAGWYLYEPTNRCRKINKKAVTKAPCPAGSYRNVDTGRCKKRTTIRTVSALPCPEGKYRNPATNRCKSIVSLSLARAACPAGSSRNPATNRCRKINTAVAQLKPCKEGWERNPETNRCKKSTLLAAANEEATPYPVIGSVTRTSETTGTMLGWWIAGGAIALATSRIVWEWRSELRTGWAKIKQKVGR